jgi:hypothetical protein
MATLAEEKERNRRLRAEAEVRKEFLIMNEERERLRRENKQLERGGKPSATKRLKAAFTRTGQTAYKGFKPLGKGIKEYGEYLAGPERKEKGEGPKHKTYFKKVGKNKYKKVVLRHKQRPQARQATHSQFGQSYFGGGHSMFGHSDIHSKSSDLFRRTF